MVFDENGHIIYPTGGRIILKEEEWNKIKEGQTVTVKQEMKRFDQAVTFILLPYIQNGEFIGGILLASPISGSREMISQINQYLWYAVINCTYCSLLLSWLLSKVHVNRIKRLQEATSLVSAGDYTVDFLLPNLMKLVNWQKISMKWCKNCKNQMKKLKVLKIGDVSLWQMCPMNFEPH